MIRIGVTGTDTGVGKTVVTAALLALLAGRGLRVAGMKPVETGITAGDPESDAALLGAAAGGTLPPEMVSPIVLPEPLAPWLAAERAGVPIDLGRLDEAFAALSEGKGYILVEGAGGLLVPLNSKLRFDGLFRRWGLDLIVVGANRLGVLNHTLLTVEAAARAGLRVRGIVLNEGAGPPPSSAAHPEGGTHPLARETNLGALRALLPGIPVATFPWVERSRDPGALAAAAERAGLYALVAPLPAP